MQTRRRALLQNACGTELIMRDVESVSSSTFSPFLVSCPESLRGAVAAAAQLLALDGARRLPARAAVRHLGQRLLGQRRATTASGLPSLGSGPREQRGFSWGAEDAQSQHQQLSRLILPSPLPGAAGFPCRSLPFPLLLLSPAGTDQVLWFFSLFLQAKFSSANIFRDAPLQSAGLKLC